MNPTNLITAREAAQRLQVAVGTLKRWRRGHAGPPWCRVGSRSIRYSLPLLEAWLEAEGLMLTGQTEIPASPDRRHVPLPGIILPAACDLPLMPGSHITANTSQ